MFGSIGKALGAPFGMGGNKNPMMNQSKFNPMNMPGLSNARNAMFGNPQKPQGGIGPSQQMMEQKPPGMMKPPMMGQQGGEMGGMNTGMKPPQALPPPMNPMMDAQQGGIGPSMPAMQNMLQQPEQSQQPAAAGPMPDFMNKFGGQPLNRGYGRM